MTVNMGWKWELGIGKESVFGTAVSPTAWLRIASESLTQDPEGIDVPGAQGIRSVIKDRYVIGSLLPEGDITIDGVRNEVLSLLLELIMGNAASGDTYQFAASVPSFTAVVWKGDQRYTYAGCKINRAEFAASQTDKPMRLTLNVLAATQAISTSDPSASYVEAQRPLLWQDCTFQVDGSAKSAASWNCVIENNLVPDVVRNSQTRSALPEGTVRVSGEISRDWDTDSRSMLAKALAGTNATLDANFTDGVNQVNFDMDYVRFRGGPPGLDDPEGPVLATIPYEAKASSDAGLDELVVSL